MRLENPQEYLALTMIRISVLKFNPIRTQRAHINVIHCVSLYPPPSLPESLASRSMALTSSSVQW